MAGVGGGGGGGGVGSFVGFDVGEGVGSFVGFGVGKGVGFGVGLGVGGGDGGEGRVDETSDVHIKSLSCLHPVFLVQSFWSSSLVQSLPAIKTRHRTLGMPHIHC